MTMTKILRLPLLVALLAAPVALSTGCKKGPAVEALTEEQASDPIALFQQGVRFLKTPDPKTGEIDYAEAYDHFSRSAELRANPKTSFNAGWTAERIGDLQRAEKHYRRAYEGDPNYEAAIFSLTRILRANKKPEEAVEIYQKLVDANPERVDVRYDLMQALTDLERYEDAEQHAREILRQDPENAGAYRALSSMYFAQGRLGMAQLCNEKALELNDGEPGIYNNMGVTYILQKDTERAIERFQKAVKLDPKNFEANMNLGFIALDSGDYNLALGSFRAANQTDSSSRDARLGLAVALRGTGDLDGADKIYREILKSDPKFQPAYFNGSTLHEKYTRNFKAAEKYLDDFIAAHVGELSPSHEVYERKQRIQASMEEERKRQEALAAAERERKEREERNKRLLAELKSEVDKTEARLSKCDDADVVEMAGMYIEQIKMSMDDPSMAGDLKTFVDEANGMLDVCVGGDPAEAEDGGEAPE
ncbi:MAG: tetratricopeptide repeat protein [Deltaproteobacteria bacterium]|nr:MAG: tetratricopeptide repeat protein [Deltaproteobacteria bacterium]